MRADQIIEKCLSAVITVTLALILSNRKFSDLFIVLGQGHFVSTYYFQYRAGKIDRTYAFAYASAFTVVFGSYALLRPSPALLTCITSIWFGVHAIADELFLSRCQPTISRTLLALAFILEYTWLSINSTVSQGRLDSSWLLLCAFILIGWGCVLKMRTNTPFDGLDIYLLLGNAVCCGLIVGHVDYAVYPVIAWLVVYHYGNWYFNTFFRLRQDRLRIQHYLRVVTVINITVVGLALGFLLMPHTFGVLHYVYYKDYFFLWTIMHMFSTLRPSDMQHLAPRASSPRAR
jgi:hypothetical protein